MERWTLSEFTVLSTFSGAGGAARGFELAGFDVQMAVDINKNCCSTLRRNLPALDVYRRDIRDLNLVHNDFGGMLVSLPRRRFTGTEGGTPCQGSSRANYRNVGEERNLLIFEPIRLAVEGNMEFFLIENVPRFKLKAEVMAVGRVAGYHMFQTYLNTANFGVAQNRTRWFCLGLRDCCTFEWPRQRLPAITLNNLLGDMERVWGVSDRISPEMLQAMEDLDKNPGKWMRISGSTWDNGIAWPRDGRATCIMDTQKCYQKIVGIPGKIPQSLAAMIQGYPNWWDFNGTLSEVSKQITNSCPSSIIEAIALQIKRRLKL